MKTKPKYNTLQNTIYLLQTCWRVSKALLAATLALALLQLATDLIGLYIAPVILLKVEQAAPLRDMLTTILRFTLLLAAATAAHHYLQTTNTILTSRLYNHFFTEGVIKSASTSYPNTLDNAFVQKRELSSSAMLGESQETAPVAMLKEGSQLLTAVGGFILYLLLLTGLKSVLLAVIVATTAASFFVSRRINRWAFDHRTERNQQVNRLSYAANVGCSSSYAKDMRISHMQPWILEVHDKALSLLRDHFSHQEKLLMVAKAADVLLTFARNGIAYVYLIHMVIEQGLPASQFLLYFAAVTGFTSWVTTILDNVIALHKHSQELCQVREHLEWPEPFRFEGGQPLPQPKNGQYELRLEHVTYRYPGAEKATIAHMDLTIRPGEKLAIVGLNGAGKTTLVKLLCGLLDPTEGRVLLNGEDIRTFNRREYYGLFTAVFQQFSILQSSIAANIAQTETAIDMDRVRICVAQAGFTEAVEKLPHGLDTHLGKLIHDDGVELSGGQQQRMMLARALYKNAPILLLDEPTAALDPIAENDMYLRYDQIAQGRTAIYISHRLASTRFCDRVLFLQDGAIAEEGTHEELIALGGGYAALFDVQSRYYREGGDSHEENANG